MSTVDYTKDHEWISVEGDVGRSASPTTPRPSWATSSIVELPEVGSARRARARRPRWSNSVKAASEVYAPVRGEVIAVNDALVGRARRWSTPTRRATAGSSSCGWPIPSELDGLMDETAYAAFVEGLQLMRYLPLTDGRPQRHAGRDRRRLRRRRCFATCRERRALDAPLDLPRACRRDRGRARAGAHGRARTCRPASVPSFLGCRRLSPPCPGRGRPSDPARRVPDLLHALSARGRAGHAAVAVRVPDPGGADHRHGGGQRLDV